MCTRIKVSAWCMCTHVAFVWNSSDTKHKQTLRELLVTMKQQRQPNNSSSSSRVATVLLLTIALPYLLFSRCSADESSSLIIDRRATGLKKKQLQRHLKKLDQKRIRQSTLSNLLEPDVPVTDGFAIAAASAGAKSSKAAAPGAGPRTAPPVAPPTFPPTYHPSSKPSLAPTVSAQPTSKPSLTPTVSARPSSKPSLAPSVSSQPSLAPSKSGKSSPRFRRYE